MREIVEKLKRHQKNTLLSKFFKHPKSYLLRADKQVS